MKFGGVPDTPDRKFIIHLVKDYVDTLMLTRVMKDVLQVLALPRYPDSRGLAVMVFNMRLSSYRMERESTTFQ